MICTPQEAKGKQCAKDPKAWCKGDACMAWVWVRVPNPRPTNQPTFMPLPTVDGKEGYCGLIG